MPSQLSRLEIALGTQENSGPLSPAPPGAPETPAGELGLRSSQSLGGFCLSQLWWQLSNSPARARAA